MYSAWAIMIKYHRLGGLNSRNLLSQSPGNQKSKIKFPVLLVPGETYPLACRWLAAFSLCSHTDCLVYAWKGKSLQCLSSYKNTRPITLGLHLMTLFNLDCFLKEPIFKYSRTGD